MLKCSRCGTNSVYWQTAPNGQFTRTACLHCGGFNCEVVQPRSRDDDEEMASNEFALA